MECVDVCDVRVRLCGTDVCGGLQVGLAVLGKELFFFSLVDHENNEAKHIRGGAYVSRTTWRQKVGFELFNRLNSMGLSWINGVSIEIEEGLFYIA